MSIFAGLFGVLTYAFFLGTFLYAMGFVGNFPILPKTIDTGTTAPLLKTWLVDIALMALFAVQHSVMARRGFKRWWTRHIPEAMERSSYVLAATCALALLLWQWRPMAEPVIWSVTHPVGRLVLHVVFWTGWGVVLVSTFLINHFELFGLQQLWLQWRGRTAAAPVFRTPLFYRHVRHPLYVGFILAFWATPFMTAGHLLFAVANTAYILIGIWFEERDLMAQFGERYRLYREQVGMLVPKLRLRRKGPGHS